MGVAGEPGGEGDAAGGVAVAQGLDLERGHVDAGGALRGAGLAPQAEIEGLMQTVIGKSGRKSTLEGGAQDHGAAAGGVALVAQRLVARAHGRGA